MSNLFWDPSAGVIVLCKINAFLGYNEQWNLNPILAGCEDMFQPQTLPTISQSNFSFFSKRVLSHRLTETFRSAVKPWSLWTNPFYMTQSMWKTSIYYSWMLFVIWAGRSSHRPWLDFKAPNPLENTAVRNTDIGWALYMQRS
jgi:hypothetical protein